MPVRQRFCFGLFLAAVLGAGAARAEEGTKATTLGRVELFEEAGIRAELFGKLHALIKPAAGELPWLEIPWLIDLTEARQKAAAEGKPLFLFLGSGSAPIGCT